MDQVDQVREKTDIVSFIGDYITLKRAGRNFKALCPFHQEKSPSFVISPERQIWHCFGGCGKGGDVFTFLMEYEHVEFPEALRILAHRAGIHLTHSNESKEFSSQKELFYTINGLTKEFYHYVLTTHVAGEEARAYLEKRGIDKKLMETFMIGFAPQQEAALVSYLVKKKQFSQEDVMKAGLATYRGRDFVDFFKGRLLFPLIDHRDNVIGFSGRLIDGVDGDGPKYINTRETFVYHKAEHCFGLSVTKEAIRKENQVIVVEGEFDVLACFKGGVANVIAVKGTALTEQHVRLLSRYAQKITFCFDHDRAGQEAIKRSVSLVEKKGLTATVIEVAGGKDPDEALTNEPVLFKKAVREDIGVYDYLLTKEIKEVDITSAEGKKHVSDTILPFIADISNEIVKEHYVRKISEVLHISYESVAKELERLGKLGTRKQVQITLPSKQKRHKDEVLEEYLLALLLQSAIHKTLCDTVFTILGDILPEDRATQKLLYFLREYVSDGAPLDTQSVAKQIPKELLTCYDTCLLFPTPTFVDEQALVQEAEKIAKKLLTLFIQKRIRQLAQTITEKEEKNEDTRELKKEYSDLLSRLESS